MLVIKPIVAHFFHEETIPDVRNIFPLYTRSLLDPPLYSLSHLASTSVGEVRSGPVPGHFCRTGDWTVRSQTKFPGPGPGPPGTVYIGLVIQRLVKIFNKSETPRGVGCWGPLYPGVSCIYPQKPQLNRTPHQTGAVFRGKGKGMAFHTRGLPMSFPSSICSSQWSLPPQPGVASYCIELVPGKSWSGQKTSSPI